VYSPPPPTPTQNPSLALTRHRLFHRRPIIIISKRTFYRNVGVRFALMSIISLSVLNSKFNRSHRRRERTVAITLLSLLLNIIPIERVSTYETSGKSQGRRRRDCNKRSYITVHYSVYSSTVSRRQKNYSNNNDI